VTTTKRLIVEGDADKRFFEALLRHAGLEGEGISIGPPMHFGARGQGKQNALSLIPDLVGEFKDGHLTHLGVVIDADFKNVSNQGFLATKSVASELLLRLGYVESSTTTSGITYSHNDLPTVAVWIMPNNKDDGIIENWIAQSIRPSEQVLFDSARTTVSRLNPKKFHENQTSKADVATWLAWQQVPGQPIASVIGNQLVDVNAPLVESIVEWLTATFK